MQHPYDLLNTLYSQTSVVMPRRYIRRVIPGLEAIRTMRVLQPLATLFDDPNLLHVNRYSVSVAAFVGVFISFIPLPVQTIAAAVTAIVLRCNLPLSLALVWITNPITMPPMFYATYRFGAWLMHQPVQAFTFEFTPDWFIESLATIWQPLLLGSLISGLIFASLAFALTRLLWRLEVIRRWERRKDRRTAR